MQQEPDVVETVPQSEQQEEQEEENETCTNLKKAPLREGPYCFAPDIVHGNVLGLRL